MNVEGQVQRYSPAMQALHWLVALLMLSVLPLAWVMVSLPHAAPHRELLYTLHKSVGITILALAAIRLVLRARGAAPAEPHGMPRGMAVAGVASHWLLYAVLIAMPVSGYLLSAGGGNPVSYFGLFTLPAPGPDKAMQATALSVHLTLQWAAYALIALHLLATAFHAAVRRDGLLDRMLPPQRVR